MNDPQPSPRGDRYLGPDLRPRHPGSSTPQQMRKRADRRFLMGMIMLAALLAGFGLFSAVNAALLIVIGAAAVLILISWQLQRASIASLEDRR